MPYGHPVSVTISILWWGIYFGCFGMWLGAAFGMLAERVRASLSQRSDGNLDQTEYAQPTRGMITPREGQAPGALPIPLQRST
jgi:hypothetical protein